MKFTFESPLLWNRLGQAFKVEGVALTLGTFSGIEGGLISIDEIKLQQAYETIVGVPLVYPHTLDDKEDIQHVVGFVSESAIENGSLLIKGYVYNELAKKLIEQGELSAFSIEGQLTDEKLTITALALTASPAVPACRMTRVESVKLSTSSPKAERAGETEVSETMEPIETPTEVEMAQRPTRTQFFDFIKRALKEANIPDDVIRKVISVLEKMIKTPYPYPYPQPYPRPRAESTEELESLRSELASLKKTLTDVEAEKKALEEKVTAMLSARKDSILAEIKKLDKKFDVSKFLEGIEDLDTQITMLERYHSNLVRLAPSVKFELADTKSGVESKIKAEIVKMFGEDFFGGE